MSTLHDPFSVVRTLATSTPGNKLYYYSLKALEEKGVGPISRLPVSIRIILEALLRLCDGVRITKDDVKSLAQFGAQAKNGDVPFMVSRVILQDFTGVPLLVDLAAMRDAIADKGKPATSVEPNVPVHLVVDHSVQVDYFGTKEAFQQNLALEFQRNQERYRFLKWGQEAFQTFSIVPPGIGIVHQVNLEHIATVVDSKPVVGGRLLFPDTLVGTDSHTTMINGLGVVGWGVGGIEAEAAMLGQPVGLQLPEVVGFYMSGRLQEGVTATDLTLRVTQMLREAKVVGKFVEFFGPGAATLSVADRATIGNMAPEYGATMGFFPADEKTLEYLLATGRSAEHVKQVKEYLTAQGLFGIAQDEGMVFSQTLKLDLSTITPSVAGPKRPQDRLELSQLKETFVKLLKEPLTSGGYGIPATKLRSKICVHKGGFFPIEMYLDSGGTEVLQKGNEFVPWSEEEMVTNRPSTPILLQSHSEATSIQCDMVLKHGSIVIAAITSCTNTSNPSVMIAAGLLAKKAVKLGLKVDPNIKTSLAPGSRVVTDYLEKSGLQPYLNQLGFELVAYGCTTCIGNSGPLEEKIESAIKEHDLVTASVLSGNRNFEARIHGAVKANFLMSPPLVVAFAIAGRVDIDLTKEALGVNKEGKPIFLRDIWPSNQEIEKVIQSTIKPEMFKTRYGNVLNENPDWEAVEVTEDAQYRWEQNSTYIQKPPYFDTFTIEVPKQEPFKKMRALALLGDSVTTDHISPAGAFRVESTAGQYLLSLGVKPIDFNSYGSRRGNHNVMVRGTLANVRIRNLLADGKEGGFTKYFSKEHPEGVITSIFEAAEKYAEEGQPLILFAGRDYGMGSSRDWAAKGVALLGVRVVVAVSFERIHRSNLIGMGVLPLEFADPKNFNAEKWKGDVEFSLTGYEKGFTPKQSLELHIHYANGNKETLPLVSRLDSALEVDYYRHGGILPYVLRSILAKENV